MSSRNYGQATTVRRWRHLSPRHLRGLVGPGGSSLLPGSLISPALLQGEKVRQRHPTCLVDNSSLGPALLSLTTASQTGFQLIPGTPVSEGNPPTGEGFQLWDQAHPSPTVHFPASSPLSWKLTAESQAFLQWGTSLDYTSCPLPSQGSPRKRSASTNEVVHAQQHYSRVVFPILGSTAAIT